MSKKRKQILDEMPDDLLEAITSTPIKPRKKTKDTEAFDFQVELNLVQPETTGFQLTQRHRNYVQATVGDHAVRPSTRGVPPARPSTSGVPPAKQIDPLESIYSRIDVVDEELKDLKKEMKDEMAELRRMMGEIGLNVQCARSAQLQEPPNPELVPNERGLVPLFPDSRILISTSSMDELLQRNASATRFAVGLIPYLFSFGEVFKRTLADYNGNNRRTRGLDPRKLNDLLRCTQFRRPLSWSEAGVRSALSTHFWRLKRLILDLEDGRVLDDRLLTSRGLVRDHICFQGFQQAHDDHFRQLNAELQALLHDRILPEEEIDGYQILNLEDEPANGGANGGQERLERGQDRRANGGANGGQERLERGQDQRANGGQERLERGKDQRANGGVDSAQKDQSYEDEPSVIVSSATPSTAPSLNNSKEMSLNFQNNSEIQSDQMNVSEAISEVDLQLDESEDVSMNDIANC